MSSKTFPGTKIPYTLLGPAPGTTDSPIFRAHGDPGANLASVNAGNPQLFIGGEGMNKAFKLAFLACCPAFNNDPQALLTWSITVQQAAVIAARQGNAVSLLSDKTMPVHLINVVLPAQPIPPHAQPTTEAALLDLFTPGMQPKGVAANYAMLYLVPPNGNDTNAYPTATDFLTAVTRTAQNGVAVLADYNVHQVKAYPALSLEPIPVLRMCLISGSIFRPKSVPVADVAKAVYQGILQGLVAAGAGCGIDLVEFENGSGGFNAIP
jgi:hypothetical protein